ncbi:hypothetical protein SAMN05192559_10832 [Halobacillus karajensis]|uniref:Uncharacterized protein n=1 Tax=Halobacillus karajensis TaxID=195088 RepID=A0A024P5V1_9BACI|nr:hypothetical protein [Halobacillus karajensis]CDQ23702.1 hypothetical protein BN983_01953 [Halobacillus karajensis]CDQ27180.1 hypothetical protein BN981_01434 [Halobacillus karajensis]SEI03919.1 hypothetical protein SAMN05192559_10832 [Halobacillus karajensis]
MIYVYISPLHIVTLILISIIFIIDWLTKVLIYIFLVNLMLLPGLLLYKEEAKDKDMRQPQIIKEENRHAKKMLTANEIVLLWTPYIQNSMALSLQEYSKLINEDKTLEPIINLARDIRENGVQQCRFF